MLHFINADGPNRVVHYSTVLDVVHPETTGLPMDSDVYSAVIHPDAGYIYYEISGNDDNWEPTKGVLKLNVAGNTARFLPLSDPGNSVAAVIDSTGTYAYFASTAEENGPSGKLNKISLKEADQLRETPILESSMVISNTGTIGHSAVIDPDNHYAYFAANGSDMGRILRINIAGNLDENSIEYIDTPYGADISSFVMAPDGKYLYAGTSAHILKYSITESGLVQEDDTIQLTGPDTAPEVALIDPDGAHVYFGFSTGKIMKINTNVFTTYEITYDPNGATSGTTPNIQIKTHGQPLSLVDNIGPLLRSGYSFAGWNTAENGTGMAYAANANYTENESKTLYAQWVIATYSITYDPNGATSGTTPNAQTGSHDTVDITLADNTGMLSKTGHIFVGWNTEAEGGEETRYPTDQNYTTNANLRLYAEWAAKDYAQITTATNLESGEDVSTNATVVNNTFTIAAGASLTTETFTVSGTTINDGTLVADSITIQGGFLNNGNLTTKHPITVSADGNFTASSNSDITCQLSVTDGASLLSHLQSVPGVFIADGALTIVLEDAALDLPKYTFQIFEANAIEGTFDSVSLPDLPAGYFWDSATLYTAGTLHIIGTSSGMQGRPLNYPNPFRWSQGSYIGYTLMGAKDTELRIYTIRGQEIYKKSFVANVDQGALVGYNKVQITDATTAEAWSAGVYPYLILQDGDVIGRGRMVVIP